jgi:KaiC/GvpD/RAD55 family RecA-like ATPase
MIIPGPVFPGLDVMIRGAIPTIIRHGDTPQTTILIRGGPGSGKTILATQLASLFAAKFSSDVVYACVNILPSELAAQAEGLCIQPPPQRIITDWKCPAQADPNFWTGMLDLKDRTDPSWTRELFQKEIVELLKSARTHSARGVRVMVVDSMNSAYGLGADSPRAFAEDIASFAAAEGLVLIVIEERDDNEGTVSPWPFTMDMHLSMRNDGGALRVLKNRFGPIDTATAEVSIETGRGLVIHALETLREE